MRFALAITTLIAAVTAAPANDAAVGNSLAGMTWGEAQQKCGGNQKIACCNQKNTGNDNGLLNGILQDGLLGQCSKLDVAALIGVEDILNSGQCKGGAVACCQFDGEHSDKNIGLINVGLPCIALGSIL